MVEYRSTNHIMMSRPCVLSQPNPYMFGWDRTRVVLVPSRVVLGQTGTGQTQITVPYLACLDGRHSPVGRASGTPAHAQTVARSRIRRPSRMRREGHGYKVLRVTMLKAIYSVGEPKVNWRDDGR